MATFKVTNIKDSGKGSLRWAINQANKKDGEDTIKFAPKLDNKTIRPNDTLFIKDDVVIKGLQSKSGAPRITISGDHDKSGDGTAGDVGLLFDIRNNAVADFSALKITRGFAQGLDALSPGEGGKDAFSGLKVTKGHLTITDSTISNNTAIAGNGLNGSSQSNGGNAGGGIYVSSKGTLTITDSVISNNQAYGGAAPDNNSGAGGYGGHAGGGIFNNGGTVLINGSLISGNTAFGGAGGDGSGANGGEGGIGATGILQFGGSIAGYSGGQNNQPQGGPGGVPGASSGITSYFFMNVGGVAPTFTFVENSVDPRFGTPGNDTFDIIQNYQYFGLAGNDTFNNPYACSAFARGGSGNDLFNWTGAPTGDWGANGGSGDDIFKFLGNPYGSPLQPGIFDGGTGRDDLLDLRKLPASAGYVYVHLNNGQTNQGFYVDRIENLTGSNNNAIFDNLVGSDDANVIRGLGGMNLINGLGGRDRLFGGNSDDSIDGGDGRDIIKTGRGNDNANGQRGNDQIFLQGGKNNIFVNADCGNDNIFGFRDNRDTMFLDSGLWQGNKTVNQVVNQFGSFVNGLVILDFGNGNSQAIDGLQSLAAFKDDCQILP